MVPASETCRDTPSLILASGSPRRRELLARLGIPFVVRPSDVPEVLAPGEAPRAFARRLARAKAAAVAAEHRQAVVLAADTIVVKDGVVFGKPGDREEARRMLRQLAGARHQVLTAVAVVGPGGGISEALEESGVEFRSLSDEEIAAYTESPEPYDKAGGYALQGVAGGFVLAVTGSRTNVIGLPLAQVAELLGRYYSITVGSDE